MVQLNSMQGQIFSFELRRLYGKFDVKIPINDRRVIIVGANGLGKSTCINALYYLLSRQWSKLSEIDFESLLLDNSISPIELTKADVDSFTISEDNGRILPPSLRRALTLSPTLLAEFVQANPADLGKFRDVLGYPPNVLRDIQLSMKSFAGGNGPLDEASETISTLLGTDQILYLPTYRRIEKELKALLADREENRRYRSDSDLVRKFGFRNDIHAELVEFGMDDVKVRIQDTLSDLNDNNRKEFNTLAGSYLRDVIKGEGATYSSSEISRLTDHDTSRILRRVEENTLSHREKILLTQAIERLRAGNHNESDAYVAHFLTKLIHSSENLTRREKPVADFVKTCNSYLEGKELVYDELSYRLFVQEAGWKGREIELSHLSSGEKQVVSLFTHIYLSKRTYFIVIDEPELSLSVTWQKKFLPDIWASGNCTYLLAVTHSPFVFDNDFERFTFDMKDGMRRHG